MKGEVDTSFITSQRDMFTSGLAAQIGMNAFGVWLAIKSHSDYNTGECWPGMRRLSELTHMSLGAVQKSAQILLEAKLLRLVHAGKGRRSATNVARERLAIRVGSTVLCTIVIDYVPNRLRERLEKIARTVSEGKDDPEAFAQVDIIPGPGYMWDAAAKILRSAILVTELPSSTDPMSHGTLNSLQKRFLALKPPRVVDNDLSVHRDERYPAH